jgi:hypothetical protein
VVKTTTHRGYEMRKTIRLLTWINNDLESSMKRMEKLKNGESNDEVLNELIKAQDNAIIAQRRIRDSLNILRQIYNECYED